MDRGTRYHERFLDLRNEILAAGWVAIGQHHAMPAWIYAPDDETDRRITVPAVPYPGWQADMTAAEAAWKEVVA